MGMQTCDMHYNDMHELASLYYSWASARLVSSLWNLHSNTFEGILQVYEHRPKEVWTLLCGCIAFVT